MCRSMKQMAPVRGPQPLLDRLASHVLKRLTASNEETHS